jgi:hypothetical protein
MKISRDGGAITFDLRLKTKRTTTIRSADYTIVCARIKVTAECGQLAGNSAAIPSSVTLRRRLPQSLPLPGGLLPPWFSLELSREYSVAEQPLSQVVWFAFIPLLQ